MAEFRRKLVLQEGKLRNSVIRDRDQRPSDTLVVVVNALDGEVVVAGTLAAYRRAGSNSDAAGSRHASAEQRQVQNAASCAARAGNGGIRKVLRFKGRLHLRSRGIQS